MGLKTITKNVEAAAKLLNLKATLEDSNIWVQVIAADRESFKVPLMDIKSLLDSFNLNLKGIDVKLMDVKEELGALTADPKVIKDKRVTTWNYPSPNRIHCPRRTAASPPSRSQRPRERPMSSHHFGSSHSCSA